MGATVCATVERDEREVACGDKMSEPSIGENPYFGVLESRAALYEMLAGLFFTPLKQAQIDQMADRDFMAYRGVNEAFDEGVNDVSRYLRKRNTGTRQELACDFTSAFAGTKTYNGLSAVPYESVFTSEDGLLCQESYHEVYAAYRHAGMRKREGLDYPEDHLSFMCQFLAALSRRAEEQIAAGDYADALDDLVMSRDFLNRHLRSWYPTFAERAALIVKTRFYRGVLKIAQGFFDFDAETLDELVQGIREEMA